MNDGTNILNNKIPWWVSNHETGLQGWKYSLSKYILYQALEISPDMISSLYDTA